MELSSFWPCKIWSEVTLGKTQFPFYLTSMIKQNQCEVYLATYFAREKTL